MKSLKPVIKKPGRDDRERKVLLGLVDYYIKTGKPVGSNTLKESGFGDLSSATIRNYFARLEEEGYLMQQHSSGGRIPTHSAYRIYAAEYQNETLTEVREDRFFKELRNNETREISLSSTSCRETGSFDELRRLFIRSAFRPRFCH